MALPEHVKRQAMDAVGSSETAAHIRRLTLNADAATAATKVPHEPTGEPSKIIPEHVKRLAMDAVSNSETLKHIRMLQMTGSVAPMHSPHGKYSRVAAKIARMHQQGQSVDYIHNAATKGDFGRGS